MRHILIGALAVALASPHAYAAENDGQADTSPVRPAPSAAAIRLAQFHNAPGQPVDTRPPELSGDKPAFPGQTRAPYRATSPYKVAVLATKLQSPWSLAFLPSGNMLVTEKPGRMRVVSSDGALSAPIKGVPEVYYKGQVGLLDVALGPHFAEDHTIFFSFSESVGSRDSNIAIARATFDEGALALSNVAIIFRAKPAIPKSQGSNQGGRLAIAPDGTLFATIGDRSKSPPWNAAQRLDTHLGKIIHITADGKPAPDNPFIGRKDALPEIWTLGHRSEIGLAFDASGQLWETENGPRGGDELNRIERGKNYGWPMIVHGIDYPGDLINGGLTQQSGLEQPVYYWDPVIAPSGFAFYRGSLFPAWKDSVLIGALRGRMLDRLTLRDGKVVDEEPLLVEKRARIRDVRVGPDGAVYVLTDDTRLLKLTPK